MADKKATDAANVAKEKMDDLETSLDKHAEKLPELSKDSKKMVGDALPWAAGAFGLLELFWVMDLWDFLEIADKLDSVFGGLSAYAGPSKFSLWIGIILFLASAVFIGMSFMRGILDKAKSGWNFLFYGMVTTVVAGLWYLIGLSDFSSGRAFLTIVVGLGGLYALFQVRDTYKKK